MTAIEKTRYLYMVTNKLNGKQYVGTSMRESVRWSQFYGPLADAIKEDGKENFTIETIDFGEAGDILEEKARLVLAYNTMYPNGYNKEAGVRNLTSTEPVLPLHKRNNKAADSVKVILYKDYVEQLKKQRNRA